MVNVYKQNIINQNINYDSEKDLRLKVAEEIRNNKYHILQDFYEEYCKINSTLSFSSDKLYNDVNYFKMSSVPVKKRYEQILDRYVAWLEESEYDYVKNEIDTEYALKFIIPRRHRNNSGHFVLRVVEYFVSAATDQVLKSLDNNNSTLVNRVNYLMQKLGNITWETFWIDCISAFDFQSKAIQRLVSQQMLIQEEERQNVSHELHDTLLQNLAVLPVQIQSMKKFYLAEPEKMEMKLKDLENQINQAIEQGRNICINLNDFWVERKGLYYSLASFLNRISEDYGLATKLEASNKEINLEGFHAITLFRIVQEAIYNVLKHSNAKRASVKVLEINKKLVIYVEDDGDGFDVKYVMYKYPDPKHFGLISMRQRAKSLSGDFKIMSKSGKGTTIIVSIPI